MKKKTDFSQAPTEFAASRRRFLGSGALGVTGAALGSTLLMSGCGRSASAAEPQPKRLLRGGTVLTLDSVIGDFDVADVLMGGGKILAVGPNLDAGDAEVIDASGMIVMPGFVDTHRHMWQGLLRNVGPNHTLFDYLDLVLAKFAPFYTPNDVRLGNLISALAAINAGITSILDWSHISATPAHSDAAIQGLHEAGIRAVYGYGAAAGTAKPWWEDPSNPYPGDIRRLKGQHFSSSDQLLTLALAASGPEFSTVDAAVTEWNLARDVGVRISTHVGVSVLGRRGLLSALAQRVQLKDDTTYIHCATLPDTEWNMIAASGGTISLAVPIEMQMGHGTPPIQKALDLGIRPSLSIDVETSQPSDMFSQMHACFAMQRAVVNETGLGLEPAKLLTARQVLEFATIEGAKANGLASRTGTLTPGKEADVIMLQSRSINVAPMNDPVGAVVLGMDTSNVDSVFIAGRAVKRHGALVGIDVAKVMTEAQRAREALLTRAGAKPATLR